MAKKSLSKKAKSAIIKRAKQGKNVGSGNFDKIAEKAAKEYGSKEAGKRVAAAVMWKLAKKKGVTKQGKIKSTPSKKKKK